MQLTMRRKPTNRARRGFMASLTHLPLGTILDLDFDNDNEAPLTGEPLTRTIRLGHSAR